MALDTACPECQARDFKILRPGNLKQRVKELLGLYQLRCKRCQAEFEDALWRPTMIFYARCPRCLRTQLSTWDLKHYNPTSWTRFKLAIGAKRYRCHKCRCNFASFRPKREAAPSPRDYTGVCSKLESH